MIDASQKHKSNVEKLERTLNIMKENKHKISDEEKHALFVDLEFMQFIEKWRDSRGKTIDDEMVRESDRARNIDPFRVPIPVSCAKTPNFHIHRLNVC